MRNSLFFSAALSVTAQKYKLSKQQTMVFSCAVAGLSNKEIGFVLRRAENTVELHMTAILHKFKVNSRAKLIARFWMASFEELENVLTCRP